MNEIDPGGGGGGASRRRAKAAQCFRCPCSTSAHPAAAAVWVAKNKNKKSKELKERKSPLIRTSYYAAQCTRKASSRPAASYSSVMMPRVCASLS